MAKHAAAMGAVAHHLFLITGGLWGLLEGSTISRFLIDPQDPVTVGATLGLEHARRWFPATTVTDSELRCAGIRFYRFARLLCWRCQRGAVGTLASWRCQWGAVGTFLDGASCRLAFTGHFSAMLGETHTSSADRVAQLETEWVDV